MDSVELVENVFSFVQKLTNGLISIYLHSEHNRSLVKVIQVLAPVLMIVCTYQYMKYNMIMSARQYEAHIRKKHRQVKKISRKLKQLSLLNGNLYFCYMPVNHGTRLPPTYSLFLAIKEVLSNADLPGTRSLRTNLLADILHSEPATRYRSINRMDLTDTDFLDPASNDVDSLCDLNIDIMNCSREMILLGIKDFDLMYTLHRIMETVSDDSD